MSVSMPSLVVLFIVASLAPCGAAEIQRLSVEREGKIYTMSFSFDTVAERSRVRRLLTDYARLHRLHPFIQSSEVLAAEDSKVTRVRTDSEVCLFFFCVDLRRVEDITDGPGDQLSSMIVPDLSDLRSGNSVWRFEPHGSGSRVSYIGTMEPDFFVPPLVGPPLVVRGLSKELKLMIETIESLALEDEHS